MRIPKRTVEPLYHFGSSLRGPHDLGGSVILKETDHAAIRMAVDKWLGVGDMADESFKTYLSPHERRDFGAARLCLEQEFEAPDELGRAEAQSKEEIQRIVLTMRVAKSTRVKPGLYLGWENRKGGWELRTIEKTGFDIWIAPEEHLEDFAAVDLALLTEMTPRVRQAYTTHGNGDFNRIANALNFFETGYRTEWGEVRFVVFTTALESLFITSDDGIGRQFRERISRFLAADQAEQGALETMCRDIYDTRSTIIHGQAPPTSWAEINRLMLHVQDLGRRCLQKMLLDNGLFGAFCGSARDVDAVF